MGLLLPRIILNALSSVNISLKYPCMKIIVQRVIKAEVSVVDSGKVVGRINNGYLVLLGVKRGDTPRSVEQMAEKLSNLRIMSDAENKMNLSLKDAKGEILVVSQFTLYADVSAGNRPSFVNAEESVKAKQIYEMFVKHLQGLGLKVETGEFGKLMNIEATLDGPVTIIYE